MVTVGKQDIYLTKDPEITFFKKVYKRHTNFSLEFKEILPDQPTAYNNIISFTLNNGDLIHRCYLEINLPLYELKDDFITNLDYINTKTNTIQKLNNTLQIWQNKYNNLNNYVQIILKLYRKLQNALFTSNITLNILKNITDQFNFSYKYDNYVNNIEPAIFNLINIPGYINSITTAITPTNKYIYIDNLNNKYTTMLYYLKYYYYQINKYTSNIKELTKPNQINFSFAEYLGHNFFKNYSITIGGLEISSYENDFLHINQLHNITDQGLTNYLELIGHNPNLYKYNNESKGNTKVIVPLIFWFNKNAGSSLPLVALQFSSVIINVKLNSLTNIITFENYDDMYNNLLIIKIDILPNNFIKNIKLMYKNYKFNNFYVEYNCLFINYELLTLQFPCLTTEDKIDILHRYGSCYNNNELILQYPYMNINEIQNIDLYYIDVYQWTNFMKNISSCSYKEKFCFYYPYIDYNMYYGLINNPPIIKLITEVVYLDDIEREKFADTKLEYIIETTTSDINNFNYTDIYFNTNLSFSKLTKELLWYIQPYIYYNGFNINGKNKNLLFDISLLSNNNILKYQHLYFNNLDVLVLTNDNISNNYYTYLLSYKYLNNILCEGVYYHSFCLYPEETQPSGTVNLKYIKGANYILELNQNFNNEYTKILNKLHINKLQFQLKMISKNYEVLIIHNGQCLFLFV